MSELSVTYRCQRILKRKGTISWVLEVSVALTWFLTIFVLYVFEDDHYFYLPAKSFNHLFILISDIKKKSHWLWVFRTLVLFRHTQQNILQQLFNVWKLSGFNNPNFLKTCGINNKTIIIWNFSTICNKLSVQMNF